jgi:uncharacterized cupredoxin-like copper-binding protein
MFEPRRTQTAAWADNERPSSGSVLVSTSRVPRTTRLPWALAAAIVLLPSLALAGCGDDDDDSGPADSENSSATTVNATERDGTIELDRSSSAAGEVEFAITNAGELTHEFLVLKTDLAEDVLPVDDADSKVDESAPGIEVVGERDSIAPGTDATLALDGLAQGSYVIICNVPGHYGLGMHASFTVN